MSTMADYNGTVTFTYDDWGRTLSKSRGSDNVEYTWAWDNKLEGVDGTDWPDMGAAVSYDYRGNGTRHSRTEGSDTTYYHYAAGFGVTNEENGTDVRTYIGGAHFDGSSSSLGTASYYTTDHLGSTRGLYAGSENKTTENNANNPTTKVTRRLRTILMMVMGRRGWP